MKPTDVKQYVKNEFLDIKKYNLQTLTVSACGFLVYFMIVAGARVNGVSSGLIEGIAVVLGLTTIIAVGWINDHCNLITRYGATR